MKLRLIDIIRSFLITAIILVVLDVVLTTLFPLLGIMRYRLPFNVLVILFFGFRIESKYVAFMILGIQYIHSFFTVEGWALGTFTGVAVCVIIAYMRELIHFSSHIATVFITQGFQFLWFAILTVLFYLKMGDWSFGLHKWDTMIVESVIISLLAPFFFGFMERVWKLDKNSLVER